MCAAEEVVELLRSLLGTGAKWRDPLWALLSKYLGQLSSITPSAGISCYSLFFFVCLFIDTNICIGSSLEQNSVSNYSYELDRIWQVVSALSVLGKRVFDLVNFLRRISLIFMSRWP